MEFADLLEVLSSPRTYPHPCDRVEVRQTHISAVFLAGPHAYKAKKPLSLGFLDFSSLDRRRHYCLEEVRLNRRLAPRVYLGVVPVTAHQGLVTVGGGGQVLEWLVWMDRLRDEDHLRSRLRAGQLEVPELVDLARRLARFHAAAERGPRVSACGAWEVVARNARENFEQTLPHRGKTVSSRVHRRLADLSERAAAEIRPLVEDRARRDRPCDTHGDLHLEHVYRFPTQIPPDDWAVVDCIEFNERYRFADPVADAAFLVMDLNGEGRRDLGREFAAAYLEAAGDGEGAALLPFYVAYRAAVRAKVEGLEAFEEEVPAAEREAALAAARLHWLLALGELEEPGARPCVLCLGGLPGTGKSTLARELGRRHGFEVLDTDRVRKELAGLPTEATASASFGAGVYTAEWTERVYGECLRRTERILFEGGRALIDGSFRQEQWRRRALAVAGEHGVRGVFLDCRAAPERVRERLAARTPGPSDADWGIYEALAARWEPFAEATSRRVREVDTGTGVDSAVDSAAAVLRAEGLA